VSRTWDTTPKADGFRMPAEWETHRQTWMLWPERPDNWRLGAKPAQRAFVEVATAIARFEPVTMGVSHDQFRNARAALPAHVRVVELSSNDAWMRDCGPAFVVDDKGGVRLVDWGFNAWGGLFDGLYFPWDLDEQVPLKVAELEGVDRYVAPMVLEGGAFLVDGQGTLLTTEECLLSPGRNPHLSKGEMERILDDYLGVEKVVWLGRGIDPEETNGHVDGVAHYVAPGEVLLAWTDDPQDYRHEICRDNLARLKAATDAAGRRFTVHKMPEPPWDEVTAGDLEGVDVVEGSRRRLPGPMAGTYVNLYTCNGGVVFEEAGAPSDETARRILERVFPDRTVVGVSPQATHEIALGGGGAHCITQQQPAGSADGHRLP
jgi:agmatine deiminase